MISLKADNPNYNTSFPSYANSENPTRNEMQSLNFFSPVNSNYDELKLDDFRRSNKINYDCNSNNNIEIKENLIPTPLNEKNLNINKGQKKTLVLDLDETLVHSSMTPFQNKDNIVLTINYEGKNYTIYVIKRPFLDKFLNEVSIFYDVIIFTASIGQYSELLLKFIDQNRVVKNVLNRDYCNYYEGCYFKNLRIFNRHYKDIIIIDNNPISYALNKDNGIPIESWFDDPNDTELLKLLPFLKFLSKVNDVRPFINSAINKKSGQIDFFYINQLLDNVNQLNSIINKKVNNQNINLNIDNTDKSNENKIKLNPNMGLIMNNSYVINNDQMNKNINNINLIDKMNININNNFDIIYNNNKNNSKTLNRKFIQKNENKKKSITPNFYKKEKKNNYHKIHVEKISNNNNNENNNRYNVIVKKLTSMNPYKNNYAEKSTNNNLNIMEKNTPLYPKYDSEKESFQDSIEENKKDDENKKDKKAIMIQRNTYNVHQKANNNCKYQSNTYLLTQQNPKKKTFKISNSKTQNTLLIEDFHVINDKTRNNTDIYENKYFKEELTNKETQRQNQINNEIYKLKSYNIHNSEFSNINSPKKINSLTVKKLDTTTFNSSKANLIKPKILFIDSKHINNNYNIKKNEASSSKKNKIVVMKIIKPNSKSSHLSYSSNELKFNLTYNSNKYNNNAFSNEQKYKNLKLNENDKSTRYIYSPFNLINSKIDKYDINGNNPPKKNHKNYNDNKKYNNNVNVIKI